MTRSRRALRALATIAISALICGPWALAEDRVVNVYNWSDYIDKENLKEFTKETGIKVVYDTYPGDEQAETILLEGNSRYDIVIPGAPFLQHEIKARALAKLDKSKLNNLGNLSPEVLKERDVYDPGAQYSVPYMWGTTGIGINVMKVKERLGDTPLDSWDIVLKPENAAKLKDCGISFLDTPVYILPNVLNYLRLKPNSHDPADIEKAFAVLKRIRGSIQKFDNDNYISALADGDICVAVGYSGDVLQAKQFAEDAKKGVEIQYIIPKEGALKWFDGIAIPIGAPHWINAHAFIDFMQRPEIAAKNSNSIKYPNGNKASQAYLDKTFLENPVIYPPPSVMAKLFISTLPDNMRIFTRPWLDLTSGAP
jgi:putrescine transport system substrate-binding protein